MRLEGVHHVTAITADDSKRRLLRPGSGLRLVKKTVNQDDPTVYHLFYADEQGSPGSDITFFEYPGAGQGRAGAGMVHRVVWRVADEAALDFWEHRLRDGEADTEREPGRLRFADPEGLGLELAVVETPDRPLISHHPDVPEEAALRIRRRSRLHAGRAPGAGFLVDSLGFQTSDGETYEARGEERGSFYAYDRTDEPGVPGAGTIHHVAWSSPIEDHEGLAGPGDGRRGHAHTGHRPLLLQVDLLREPSGVLFEIATLGPGSRRTSRWSRSASGRRCRRTSSSTEQVERTLLTPLPDPRAKTPVS